MDAVMGKVLMVDLGAKTFEERAIDEAIYDEWIGGIGLAVHLLYDEIPAGADPLGPHNVIAFMSGALTGTGAVMTGRWMVACKSPLTGGWADSNCGGTLSPAIKQCGWDGIFFRGISERPVIFVADADGPRLIPAEDLWGLDALETEDKISTEWKGGRKPAVAAIGYAAEKLSLISGISNDHGRYAARSGVGAVMGSKRLKALALSGSGKITCADRERVLELSRGYTEKLKGASLPGFVKGRNLAMVGKALAAPAVVRLSGLLGAAFLKKWGTIYNNTMGLENGDTPAKNWVGSKKDFPASSYSKLDPDLLVGREVRKYHCYSCVLGCGGICDVRGVVPGRETSHKPEYETCAAFGALSLNDDLETIFRCNDICNRSGLDTISAGSTIAFAIECREKGFLSEDTLEGIDLRWGNGEAIEAFLIKMSRREGVGALFADGTKRASEFLGKGTKEFAMHSGGQEPGMHDSRLDPIMGLAYSVDPTPGRHTIAADLYYDFASLWSKVTWAPKPAFVYPKSAEYNVDERESLKSVASVLFKQVLDAAGGCLFAMISGVDNWPIFEFLNAAAGRNLSPDQYLEIGRKIQTRRQLFNVKHGIVPSHNFIPERMRGVPPLKAGPLRGRKIDLEGMIKLHWKYMGWDEETGVPREGVN
jgi:aldehyde:ferredoxin oxidoreductase